VVSDVVPGIEGWRGCSVPQALDGVHLNEYSAARNSTSTASRVNWLKAPWKLGQPLTTEDLVVARDAYAHQINWHSVGIEALIFAARRSKHLWDGPHCRESVVQMRIMESWERVVSKDESLAWSLLPLRDYYTGVDAETPSDDILCLARDYDFDSVERVLSSGVTVPDTIRYFLDNDVDDSLMKTVIESFGSGMQE